MFHFKLVSISGKKFDDDVSEVVLPTLDGEIGILTDHMPLVSVAKAGPVLVRKKDHDPDSSREIFAINGGAIEVADNSLRVIVDEADSAEEINEAETKAALERAKSMIKDAKDSVSLEHAQSMIDRYEVRLHVAGLKRHHRQNRI